MDHDSEHSRTTRSTRPRRSGTAARSAGTAAGRQAWRVRESRGRRVRDREGWPVGALHAERWGSRSVPGEKPPRGASDARVHRDHGVDMLYPPASSDGNRDPRCARAVGISRAMSRASASLPNGTSGPVSRSFQYPRMPADARSRSAQVSACSRNALRDNRFVPAAVRDS